MQRSMLLCVCLWLDLKMDKPTGMEHRVPLQIQLLSPNACSHVRKSVIATTQQWRRGNMAKFIPSMCRPLTQRLH